MKIKGKIFLAVVIFVLLFQTVSAAAKDGEVGYQRRSGEVVFLLDARNKISVYWYPEFLYLYTREQEEFLQKELQKKFIRVKKYEIEILRRELFSSYWNIAKGYLGGDCRYKAKRKFAGLLW